MNNLIVLFKHTSIVYNTVVRKQSEEAMGAVQSLWWYRIQNTAEKHTKVKISGNHGRI
jgi:uncharacterized protein (DUF2225 family)